MGQCHKIFNTGFFFNIFWCWCSGRGPPYSLSNTVCVARRIPSRSTALKKLQETYPIGYSDFTGFYEN